jgi:hypothetical protein
MTTADPAAEPDPFDAAVDREVEKRLRERALAAIRAGDLLLTAEATRIQVYADGLICSRNPDGTPAIDKLLAALAEAQATIKNADKSQANEAFKQGESRKPSKYATLADVLDACRGSLATAGICTPQLPSRLDSGDVLVRTMLGHKSGQWLISELSMPVLQKTPHAIGSAITYGRRYSLAAMATVAPDDDDGNAAASVGQQQQQSNGGTSQERGGGDQLAALRGAIKRDFKAAGKWQSVRELCTAAGVVPTPLDKMPAADMRKLHDFLKAALTPSDTPAGDATDTSPRTMDNPADPGEREPGEDDEADRVADDLVDGVGAR